MTFVSRENAYRANNLGVSLLEQYRAKDAAAAFNRALEIDPKLFIARSNLSIALYYIPDLAGALEQAQKVVAQSPRAPQPHYIIALIARRENRIEDAINEFEKVRQTDPSDVGTNVNLGQLYVQQKKYPEATAAFRRAITAEPYNETALYNLGILLMRTGPKEEGRRLIERFQKLRDSGAGTTIGTNYLEQGRYAEAIVSTGMEPELLDRRTPDVKFVDASKDVLPLVDQGLKPTGHSRFESAIFDANARAEAIVLFDYDGDGDLDIFDASGSQRLLRNDAGKLSDATTDSGLAISGSRYCFAAVAGDYDNDGKPDLFVVRAADNSFVLYHNDGNGHFSNTTNKTGITAPGKGAPYVSAAFVDADHDGDLDIFVTGPSNILLRNNGDGSFVDISRTAKITAQYASSTARAVVPTDFDNRRDVDLLVLNARNPPTLFSNMRDGTFHDLAKEAGLVNRGAFWCAAAGDVNKDGFTDFFLGVDRPGVFAMSDGHGHFRFVSAARETTNALAAQFLDYDNDGLLDLVVLTTRGLRLWHNAGDSFLDTSRGALSRSFRNFNELSVNRGMLTSQAAFASGDLDGDGDVDLMLRQFNGQLRVLRNEGGNRNHSIHVNLRGLVSNKSAVQAKVEMRAGSLVQKLETYAASPAPAPADIIFGLGKRQTADAVRVSWPAGIVQAETNIVTAARAKAGNSITLNITELDRKPSSCPYLYTWNGERYEFVTDFMGGGEMGYLEGPGHYNKPDPVEYVRIRDDQLKEKNGRFELRVTNELEEALFLDRLQLLVVAHPRDTDIYPNEGMTDPPKPFKLYVIRGARPPLTAFDDHGHDMRELIAFIDRRYADDFQLDRIRGYAVEHTLTLNLGNSGSAGVSPPCARSNKQDCGNSTKVRIPRSSEQDARGPIKRGAGSSSNEVRALGRTVLLLTGWTDYAWSSDNLAASQAGKTMKLPALQVKDESGDWRTVIKDIGIPVGRPQTVTVDLTDKFLSANRDVRIVTNMRIYWDRILVDTSDGDAPTEITKLEPTFANLRWRGFSHEVASDRREPFGYDYEHVSFTSPWKVMTGRYTREGDVLELLTKSDDMFVISRPGDEIGISFDASRLPTLPAGWKRTFLLYADGFSKEMDINSASPDQTAPLPFHGMSRYPYSWPEAYPMTEARRSYIDKYNTRIVTTNVPLIETIIGQK